MTIATKERAGAKGARTFRWRDLGDFVSGRPNLGGSVRLEMYRLLEMSLCEVLEREKGSEETERILREAGRIAGGAFRRHFLPPTDDLAEYLGELEETLRTMGVAILRVEELDAEAGRFVLVVSEDMSASGLSPGVAEEGAAYAEGFVSAVVEGFAGRQYRVRETERRCRGERVCRFVAAAGK